MMGLWTMLGFPEPKGYDFDDMAAQRLGHGLEPIDWKTILSNQLRAEQACGQLKEWEQNLLDSLTK